MIPRCRYWSGGGSPYWVIDPDFIEQPREIDDEVLYAAFLVAVAKESEAFRMVAFCQLVARL